MILLEIECSTLQQISTSSLVLSVSASIASTVFRPFRIAMLAITHVKFARALKEISAFTAMLHQKGHSATLHVFVILASMMI